MAESVEPQMFSDGVFVRKKFMGEHVVDHGNAPGGRRIALFDAPTTQEMRADGLEIVRAYIVVDRIIIVCIHSWLASLNPDLSLQFQPSIGLWRARLALR